VQALMIMGLMSALWRVHLMLALNRSILNRGYTLINALKRLASIIPMCSLRVYVILVLTFTPFRYLQVECSAHSV
jgi:hypothetical protein